MNFKALLNTQKHIPTNNHSLSSTKLPKQWVVME